MSLLLHHPDMIGSVRTVDGDELARRRNALHWTQRQLAERADVSERTVHNAERGHVADRSLGRIEQALDDGEAAKVKVDQPELVTVTHTVETADGPIRVVVTASRESVGRLDFAALVAKAIQHNTK